MQVSKLALKQDSINSHLTTQHSSSQEPQSYNLNQMFLNQNFDEKLNKLSESINKLLKCTYLKYPKHQTTVCVFFTNKDAKTASSPPPLQYGNSPSGSIATKITTVIDLVFQNDLNLQIGSRIQVTYGFATLHLRKNIGNVPHPVR